MRDNNHSLENIDEEFRELYQQMQSPVQRSALKGLAQTSDEELRATFRPGQTENSAESDD